MGQEKTVKYYEMTDIQRDIWEMMRALPDTAIVNNGGLVKMPSNLTARQVMDINRRLVKRNPALRLCLSKDHRLYLSEEVREMVFVDFDVPCKENEFGKDMSRRNFEAKAEQWFRRPRPLCDAPLCEMWLLKFQGELYILGMFHHMVMDNIGIYQYVAAFYGGGCPEERDDRFLELIKEPQEIGKYGQRLIDAWKGRTVDWKLKEQASDGSASMFQYVLPKKLTKDLLEAAHAQKVSLEAAMCAALYIYISKVCGAKSVALGKHFINRTKKQMDMIGMTVATLPVYMEIVPEETFFEFCRRIGREYFGLMRCGGLSLGRLRREAEIEEMPFDVCISYRNDRYLTLSMADGGFEMFNGSCEVPLRIMINESGDAVTLVFIYQDACYDQEEIVRLCRSTVCILEQTGNDPAVGNVDILPPEERALIQRCNDVYRWKFERSIWDEFCALAYEKKDEILWEEAEGGDTLTFAQAKSAVCGMAALLEGRGVRSGSVVGLVLARDVLLPVAMMAVLKAGGAFLPIGFGEDEETIRELSAYCTQIVSSRPLSISHIKFDKGLLLHFWTEDSENRRDDDAWNHRPGDAAYGIFTSGSTGNPKIALVTEQALTCRLQWMRDQFGLRGRILQKTVNTFDVSVWELLLPFVGGNRTCLLCDGDEKFPDAIAAAAAKSRTEILHFVPSMLAPQLRYLEMDQAKKEREALRGTLKYLFCSGEALTAALAAWAHRVFPDTVIVNLYGPAECTIDVAWHVYVPGEDPVPIGLPVYNTELHVCSGSGEELPIGVEGELIIAGDLVGLGYLNNQAEQEKRFFESEGKRCYRTGDRVKRLPNGEVCYLRRENQETKVRGIRVDLEEIERLMMEVLQVNRACVLVHGYSLCAFYESEQVISDWRKRLGTKLPRQSMPGHFVHMDAFPLQKNGKTDRAALIKRLEDIISHNSSDKKMAGKQVRSVVEEHFTRKQVSDDENLFEAGMDSLTAVCIISDLLELGYRLNYRDLYEHPSIGALQEYIGGNMSRKQEVLQYIERDGAIVSERTADHVLLCVPYAAGGFSEFLNLAKLLWQHEIQVCVVDLDAMEGMSVREMAKRTADCARDIPRLSILGCCVGSALAVAVARLYENSERPAGSLYLCGALPYTCNRNGRVLWDYLSPYATDWVFSYLHGKKMVLGDDFRRRLLRDARASGLFFRDIRTQLSHTGTYVLYGGRDILTAGFLARKGAWRRFLGKEFKAVKIAGAGHFFVNTHPERVASIILRQEGASDV